MNIDELNKRMEEAHEHADRVRRAASAIVWISYAGYAMAALALIYVVVHFIVKFW